MGDNPLNELVFRGEKYPDHVCFTVTMTVIYPLIDSVFPIQTSPLNMDKSPYADQAAWTAEQQ